MIRRNLYALLGDLLLLYRKRLIFAVFVLSFLPFYFVQHLEIRTDYAELISQDAPYQREFNKYIQHFGASEALYVLISSPHAFQIADEAYPLLLELKDSRGKKVVKGVRYRIPPRFLETFGLLLAPPDSFQQIRKELSENAPFLRQVLQAQDLAQFVATMSQFLAKQQRENAFKGLQASPEKAEFFPKFLQALEEALKDRQPNLPGLFEGTHSEKAYHVNAKGYFVLPGPTETPHVLMQIFPTTTSDDYEELKVFLTLVDGVFQKFRQKFSAKVLYSGSPKLTVDEVEDGNRDMQVLSLIAIVGVSFVFIYFFGRILWPLLGILTLAIAILWTFGFAYLFFGYLNIISIVFAVVLVGLGVDFGIHFIERYGEFLCTHPTAFSEQAAKEAILHSGLAITTSALTTSAAFYISAFSGFQGSFQLGILAGTGILLCLVFMLTLLPALLLTLEKLSRTSVPDIERCSRSLIMEAIDWFTDRPKVVFFFTALICSFGLWAYPHIRFDSNLLNLQRQDSEAVKLEKALMEEYGLSFRFAILLRERWTLEEIYQLVDQLKKLPTVHPQRIESIANLLPPWREERRKELLQLSKKVLPPSLPPLKDELPPAEKLAQALEQLAEICDSFSAKALSARHTQWAELFDQLAEKAEQLAELCGQQQTLPSACLNLQRELLSQFRQLSSLLTPPPLSLGRIPVELLDYFVSPQGMTAIYIYPKVDVREPEHLRAFVQELRSVDPHVTGPSVQTFEVTREMKEGYQKAGVLALIAVYFILLLEFQSFWTAFLAIVPLVLGALMMAGGMYLWDIPFNPANLMALPLLFGVGVDNSIHILHRYYSEGERDVSHILRFTGKAILVTSLTTGIGFGCLAAAPLVNGLSHLVGGEALVSGHRGLSSLGLIMTLGVAACFYTSIVFLPACLKLTAKKEKL